MNTSYRKIITVLLTVSYLIMMAVPLFAATIEVTSVSLDKTSTTISVGRSETLKATISPSNATVKTLTWNSSNTAVATVNFNGKVTGVSAGTAKITVASNNGCKRNCIVIVSSTPIIRTVACNPTSVNTNSVVKISALVDVSKPDALKLEFKNPGGGWSGKYIPYTDEPKKNPDGSYTYIFNQLIQGTISGYCDQYFRVIASKAGNNDVISSECKITVYTPPVNEPIQYYKYTDNGWTVTQYWNDSRTTNIGHLGLDMTNGNPAIPAFANGTVVMTGLSSANGNTVIIKHTVKNNTFYSFYAHLASISVKKGSQVTTGQQIGIMGNTGNSSGPHLHFSVFTGNPTLDLYGYNRNSNKQQQAFDDRGTGVWMYKGYTFYDPVRFWNGTFF